MSKELTPLEVLKRLNDFALEFVKNALDERFVMASCDIIENALKRLETLEEEKQSFDRQLEKKLKALEIIKKKRVDVNDLLSFYHLKDYNEFVCASDDNKKRQLIQEEYDLLKEVLL